MVNDTKRVLWVDDKVGSEAALRYIFAFQEEYLYTVMDYSNYITRPSFSWRSVWQFPSWAWYHE